MWENHLSRSNLSFKKHGHLRPTVSAVNQGGASGFPFLGPAESPGPASLPPSPGNSLCREEKGLSQVRMFAQRLCCKQKPQTEVFRSPQASFPQALFAPVLWFLCTTPLLPHTHHVPESLGHPRAGGSSLLVLLSKQKNQGPKFFMAC